MSIRVIVCVLFTLFFCCYAWRNYFVSLCATIVMMAVMQHPDMIADLKNIGGIQGLNPWNVLMLSVFLAWRVQRKYEHAHWDMPRYLNKLLIGYVIIIAISVVRLLAASGRETTVGTAISEYFINSVKWVIPGLILFDSCRTRKRIVLGLLSIGLLYFLLALQVIKHVPISYAAADNFSHRAYKMVQDAVGYNRVTLSMMLGGACWGIVALLPLAEKKMHKWIIMGSAAAVTFGQALTGGRSGYVGWMAVGIILCVVKWRRLLPLIPTAIIAVCIALPSVRDRMMQGIGLGDKTTNTYEMTSGRNIAWPYVIAKIEEAPILGYGRDAMTTTGIYDRILDETDGQESFPHPHNAYLQILLDCGLIGFAVVVPFYVVILRQSFQLFKDSSDPLYAAAGGMTCALVLALMVASMGGETFYPREGAVGMWAAMGIMLRVFLERSRTKQQTGRNSLSALSNASSTDEETQDVSTADEKQ